MTYKPTDFDLFTSGTHPFAVINPTGELVGVRKEEHGACQLLLAESQIDFLYQAELVGWKLVRGCNKERLQELSFGYDLDGGGYSFENPDPTGLLAGCCCVVWDDPDLDYIGLQDLVRTGNLSLPLLAFAPNSGHFRAIEFPEGWVHDEDGRMVRVASGDLNTTDHECNCHGELRRWIGAAGEPTAPIPDDDLLRWLEKRKAGIQPLDLTLRPVHWVRTDSQHGDPYPGCDRCDGDGYLTSHGGEWAVYGYEENPEIEENDED